jgi:hypothetical protein
MVPGSTSSVLPVRRSASSSSMRAHPRFGGSGVVEGICAEDRDPLRHNSLTRSVLPPPQFAHRRGRSSPAVEVATPALIRAGCGALPPRLPSCPPPWPSAIATAGAGRASAAAPGGGERFATVSSLPQIERRRCSNHRSTARSAGPEEVAATGSSSVTGMRGSMRGIGGGQRAEQQRGCGAWPNGVGKEEEAERWGLLAVGMGKAPEP